MKANKPRKWIDPEKFRLSRLRAGLTREAAAEKLDVTLNTIRNWEESHSPVPYAAFRMMRLYGGYMLADNGWENWTMWKGKLYSPAGRSFEAHELLYVSNYFTSARLFLKERKSVKSQTPNPVTIASDRRAARPRCSAPNRVVKAMSLPFVRAVCKKACLVQYQGDKLEVSPLRSMQAARCRMQLRLFFYCRPQNKSKT